MPDDGVRYLRTKSGTVHRVIWRPDGSRLTDERCNLDDADGWTAVTVEEAMKNPCEHCFGDTAEASVS